MDDGADLENAPSKMDLFKQMSRSAFIRRSDVVIEEEEPQSLLTKDERRLARRRTWARKSSRKFVLRAVSEPILPYWEIIPDIELSDLVAQPVKKRKSTLSSSVIRVKPKKETAKSSSQLKPQHRRSFKALRDQQIVKDIKLMSSLNIPVSAREYQSSPTSRNPCDIYVQDDGSKMIRSGSLEAIIKQVLRWLVDSSDTKQRTVGMEILDILMLTFVRFSTPSNLLSIVISLYKSHPDLRPGAVMLLLKWLEKRRKPDFMDSTNKATGLCLELEEFLDSLADSSAKTVLKKQTRICIKVGSKVEAVLNSAALPPPSPKSPKRKTDEKKWWHKKEKALPSNFDFIDLQPREVAEQLTLLDLQVLQRVSLDELVFNNEKVASFIKEQNKESLLSQKGSVNMAMAAIGAFAYLSNRWNKVSGWVASEIVTTAALKQRAEVMKRFIALGEYLAELRNYHSLMAVLSGLNKPAISRLKKTTKTIGSKHMDKLKALENLMSFDNNYETYRKLLKAHMDEGLASIPFVALYTRDLTFINENPEYLDDAKTQINFDKLYLIGQVISQVRDQQSCTYPDLDETKAAKRPTAVREYLAKLSNTFDDDVLYKMSLRCEERSRVVA